MHAEIQYLWIHSNAKAIEAENTTKIEEEQTYAKQQLEVKMGETKLLRLAWDKNRDSIQITVRNEAAENTKRKIGKDIRPTWPGITTDINRENALS